MKLAKLAIALLAMTAAAAAQGNPIEGARKLLTNGTADHRNAQNAAAEAVTGKDTPAAAGPGAKASPMSPKPAAGSRSAKPSSKAAPEMARQGGKRDPFVSPVMRATGKGPTATCTTGKRCLLISEMSLKGIVKAA